MKRFVVLLGVAVLSTTAGAARAEWAPRDFKVKSLSAFVGASAESFVDIRGKISSAALDAGLQPRVAFTYEATLACGSLTNAADVIESAISGGSRTSAPFVAEEPVSLTKTNGAYAEWATSFTFHFDSFMFACPAGYAAASLTLTSLRVTAWAGGAIGGPPPGIATYAYEVGPGAYRANTSHRAE